MIGSVTVETVNRIVHVRTQNIGSSLSSCSILLSSLCPLYPPPCPCFIIPAHAYFTSLSYLNPLPMFIQV